jgi:hypothetical protein
MSASLTADSAPRGHTLSPGALWFGLFGAPAAWSLQLLTGYALTAHACLSAAIPRTAMVSGGSWVAAVMVGVAALGFATAAGATAGRSWRRSGTERTRFMSLAGMLLSGLFLIGVVMAGIPLILRPACG